MEDFDVPGYVVDRLLGFGATGEVWAAHPAAGGDPVALKRLLPPADVASNEEARQRLRRQAQTLTAIDDPHVVRLHRVLRSSSGDDVLVLDLAAGGSLASLLLARGRLTAGEVVTIAVPLAQSLAGAHRRGILHGNVSTANVLFAVDGRPMLADLGVAGLTGEPVGALHTTTGFTDPALLSGAPPRPASDVYGLAAVCWTALTGRVCDVSVSAMSTPARAEALCAAAPGTPPELAAVVARGLSADVAARPDAAEFASLVWGCAPPQPVRLPGSAERRSPVNGAGSRPTHRIRSAATDAAPEPAHRRRPRWRRWSGRSAPRRAVDRGLALLVVPLLLASAVWAGTRWADSSGGQDAAHAAEAVPDTDWSAVLARLDDRWTAAFASGDPQALHSVDAPASPALAGDSTLLQRFIDAGVVARGLRIERLKVDVGSETAEQVSVDVVDRIAPYELVDATGAVVRTDPGRAERSWRITLVPAGDADGEWRVASVTNAAA